MCEVDFGGGGGGNAALKKNIGSKIMRFQTLGMQISRMGWDMFLRKKTREIIVLFRINLVGGRMQLFQKWGREICWYASL